MSNSKGSRYEHMYAKHRNGRKISRLGYPGPDVEVPELEAGPFTMVEVKYRGTLPAWLEGWQEEVERKGADYLAFKRARGDWWVLMPESRLREVK